MKITIDLSQSPASLRKDLDSAVRFALGASFYIEQSESGNFTADELADPQTNLSTAPVTPALPALASATASQTAASTPAAQSSPAAQGAGGVEVDVEGHPYDVRIHSAGKSKIANGTWKLKKGVDKALVEQINAQNKTLMGSPLPKAPALTIVSQTLGPSVVSELPTLAPVVAALPTLPTLPPVAQVPAADVEIVVTDYPSFAQYAAQQLVIRPVGAKTQLDAGLTHYGLVDANGAPDLPALAHKPEVVGPLYQWFKAVVGLLPTEAA